MRFTLYIIDGDFLDLADDPAMGLLSFDDLDAAEALFLAKLAFRQGYQAVICQEGGVADGAEKGGAEL